MLTLALVLDEASAPLALLGLDARVIAVSAVPLQPFDWFVLESDEDVFCVCSNTLILSNGCPTIIPHIPAE